LQVAPGPDPYRPPFAGVVGSLLKLAIPVGLIALGIYSYKRCMVATTRPVGTHWESKELALALDFPDAGWRVAPGLGKQVTQARAEYFYRGNAPELPVVGLIVVRGSAADVAASAETLLAAVVQDLQPVGCRESYAREAAIMCVGLGTVGLFGQPLQDAEVEVHGWPLGGDVVLAAMIKPDHTLAETELILGSITDRP
ncbi:MAG TPA: hypothetical protein VM734_35535, partial [Kofleriaceae bacterium]|nr:hypothetical protein [Kofleriaceae bacterium]